VSKRAFLFFALLLTQPGFAGEVPTELFGVTLGMTTTRTQDNPAGGMGVKRLTGLLPWSRGARYYFEPLQDSEAFPYFEYESNEGTAYDTSHSSLVLPVIPAEVKTRDEWKKYASIYGEQFTVMTVGYTSRLYDSAHAAYLVASSLCEDLIGRLGLEPFREIDTEADGTNGYTRTCTFVTDNRELEVAQAGPKYVYVLKFPDEYINEADQAVGERASELLPDVTASVSE